MQAPAIPYLFPRLEGVGNLPIPLPLPPAPEYLALAFGTDLIYDLRKH